MEPNKAQETQYRKGFNHGYILSEYEPKIHANIVRSENSRSYYFQGLTDGGLQYQSEQFEERLKKTNEKRQLKDRSGRKH